MPIVTMTSRTGKVTLISRGVLAPGSFRVVAPFGSIAPWYKGQTFPVLTMQLQDDQGNFPPSLTGATFTLTITNATDATAVRTLSTQGNFTITGASTGGLTYAWQAADVALVGKFRLQLTVTLAGGGIIVYDPIDWQVVTAQTIN